MITIRVTPLGVGEASGIPIDLPGDTLCVVAIRKASAVHSADRDRMLAEVIIPGETRPRKQGMVSLETACDAVNCGPTRREGRHVFLRRLGGENWFVCVMETWRQRAERLETALREAGGT